MNWNFSVWTLSSRKKINDVRYEYPAFKEAGENDENIYAS